jgi:hypothetical protein
LRNNHVSKEKEFSVALGSNLNVFSLREQSCPQGGISVEVISPLRTWLLPKVT